MTVTRFRKVVDLALILALLVVMLGAYTRLTNAGLGCPDWPGCYGHLIVQQEPNHLLLSTQSQYSITPLDSRKAWTEMVHRYAAGTLALLIFFIGIHALKQRYRGDKSTVCFIPILLMVLLVFQALLGMWTVTLKLLPVVVMAHLLGGILIFSGLACLRLTLNPDYRVSLPGWRKAIGVAVIIVFCQIALGGWVSANYAGIACVGFPRCNGQWLPSFYFAEGFNLLSPLGENYQGGVLDNSIRVTIQMMHRLGALLTLSYLFVLSGLLLKKVADARIQKFAIAIIVLLALQFLLGMINVLYQLPLAVAVLHNGFAALSMAFVLMLFCVSRESDLA
ncbi:MAG: cytochrome B [Legionellales bacterium RIFCSPHIGHO2_12_FULL_42_9]|nr:MAG: cytochrome B [Legionellales bacterium RIFCSPHIGHO2_12_FULL_42_9]